MTTNNQDYGNSPSVTKRGSKMVGFDENENIIKGHDINKDSS